MAHQSDIETEKYRQWVKAGLGLKYLNEGLAPFCNDVSKQQHRDILDNIKWVNNVPSVMCGTCTLKTLQPDHVKLGNKQCPYGQSNCNCLYTIDKCPCPNNVCGAIYDSIIHYHASTPPAPYWKNTQTQQWTEDPWSISKCFINAPGYGQNTSAADTDCTGLLHMIINNKYFHNHVSCNMNGPNMFSKVRQYRNEIFNSSTRGLDSKKTNSYIDDMIAVLQDGKELIHRQDAQQAVKKLQDLKNKDLVITTVDKGLGDIGENIGSNKLAMEEHKEDSEEEQIAKYETLESKSMKTAASQVKSRNNRVHLFRLLTLTIDEGTTIVRNIFDEKRLNVPLDVFLAQHRHDIKQLRKTKTITQSQYDLLFPQIGTPATTDFDFTLTICLLRNLKPFGLNQHFAWNALPQQGDTSLEADLLRLKIIRNELTNIPASTAISEQDFKSKWSDIENVYLRLNASLQNPDVNLHQRIDECKNKPFDPGALKGIEHSIDNLQTLIKSEVESLRTEFDNLTSKSDDINKEMQTLNTNQEKRKSCEVDALSEEWIAQTNQGLAKRTDISNTEVLKSAEGNLDDKSEHPSRSQTEIDKQWANARKEDLDKAKIIDVCNAVCSDIIKENPESVLSVRPAYDSTDKDHIQFIVTTKEDSDNTKFDFKYSTVVRRANTSYSNEANVAMKNTGNEEIKLSFEDSERIKLVINNRAEELFNKHRYLSVISGSGIRSRENNQGKRELIPEVCIVLYVQTKGKIPLDETEFPKFLNNIPVDVKEGEFKTCVGPVEFQNNLCMGCKIQVGSNDSAGTLGGFIEHPEYGLSAITCAHVVSNDTELHNMQRDGKTTWNDDTKSMYQPDKTDKQHHYFGQVKEARYKSGGNGTSGVDLAVVKIERRHPLSGHFPAENTANVGDNMNFKTGQACFSLNENYNAVVKFGCTTGKTNGVVNFTNAAVQLRDHQTQYTSFGQHFTYRLFNQLFVNSIIDPNIDPFVQGGDSGSLVFKKDVTGKLVCIGMVVGGLRFTGDGIITPISAILSELGVNSFKDFSLNEIEDRLSKIEEKIDLSIQHLPRTYSL